MERRSRRTVRLGLLGRNDNAKSDRPMGIHALWKSSSRWQAKSKPSEALTRNNAGQALAFPSRPKQRAGQNHERLVEEARDNGGGFTSGGGLLQFFRQDRPGLVENTN
jgi:hypothetical protein